jgi:hypothetical protein
LERASLGPKPEIRESGRKKRLIWLKAWAATADFALTRRAIRHRTWSNFAMCRTSRRWVGVVTLLGILGLQGALAAHACAMTLLPSDDPYSAAAIPSTSSHCAALASKSVPQGGVLCLEHCTKGKEASNAVANTDAPTPVVVAFLTVPAFAPPAIANSWSSPQLQSRNNSPPILVLSSRLRI